MATDCKDSVLLRILIPRTEDMPDSSLFDGTPLIATILLKLDPLRYRCWPALPVDRRRTGTPNYKVMSEDK